MPTTDSFELPILVDFIATFLWALSGGLLAARRGYDIAGVFTLALVSSTGGGLLRDGLFLQEGPPSLVRTPTYLIIVLVASAAVWLVGRHVSRIPRFDTFVIVVDAIGLGGYAVIGMQLAMRAGLTPFGVALVGVVNAVGGGVLRDVLMRREPQIFMPGTFVALAALAGCVVYQVLLAVNVHPPLAGWLTIAVVFVVNTASIYFRIQTRPLSVYPADSLPPDGGTHDQTAH